MVEIFSQDVVKCKEKLKKCCESSEISSYDVLKCCIRKLIAGECKDLQGLAALFRDVSNAAIETETNNNRQTKGVDLMYLREEKAILAQFIEESEPRDEDVIVQDIYDRASMFECTGEGLDANEFFKLKIAFRKINADYPVESIRFWGKIFGTHNDYYIIECTPGESDVFEDNVNTELARVDTGNNDGDPVEDLPLPKSIWKPCPETPREEVGKGVNSRVYFVSNFPCGPYVRLPHAEPKHIVASRLIYIPFTGELTASVASFPPFPGTEVHYLRAQIARISAATQLAPQNFYHLRLDSDDDGEDEDGNEELVQVECEENTDYVAQPLHEMGLEQWVHCKPYILPQGRVTWWNPREARNEVESEDDSGNGGDTVPPLRGLGAEPLPERGPPILTPITEDLEVKGQVPWTIRRYLGGLYLRVSSLLWPGAHTVAQKEAFENIYVGWGLKATGPVGFQTILPAVQCETLEEPVEQTDPTPEEEAVNEEEKKRDDGEGDNSCDDDDDDDDDDNEGSEEEEG